MRRRMRRKKKAGEIIVFVSLRERASPLAKRCHPPPPSLSSFAESYHALKATAGVVGVAASWAA